MSALINTIQINYYKQQCQRAQRTNQVCAYSEVRSVVGQPKCNLIQLFSCIPDDGRAPATGIRPVDFEPTDGNISPVSVRSALFKKAGYPGKVPRRAAQCRAVSPLSDVAPAGTPPLSIAFTAGASPRRATSCIAGSSPPRQAYGTAAGSSPYGNRCAIKPRYRGFPTGEQGSERVLVGSLGPDSARWLLGCLHEF